ncbi:LANO_0D02630g1_1 [Lachancea nothofagi CBS 11611]|uniref:LANO_0D02630g1_1 n=1 Tax=Lachancea nothofagi CBS 11611 TaxID=1266666 RepID=A0A1G4JEJ1_9SACH|nr:LANO_0D02630g1_1 [Lachancea nothofagi CBS 11611]
MLDQNAILEAFSRTMAADAVVIKNAEQELYHMQKEPGFTSFLLNAATDTAIPLNVRTSCAIYMKNKIQRCWVSKRDDAIVPQEQSAIRETLIQSLIANAENMQIKPYLTESVRGILDNNDTWDLSGIIHELLSSNKPEYVYPGLLLLFEVCIKHRWDMPENRQYIDSLVETVFPCVETIAAQLVNENDYRSNELLYLILKCFKYSCLNNFPRYFNNVEKLQSWIQLHLFLCSKSLPQEVLNLEPADRSLDKRVKCNKWAFGNLSRFLIKYSRSTKSITQDYVNYVFDQVVPLILNEYFKTIESWGSGSLWLSDASLYYMIEFLEKCMTTDSLWSLIQPNLESIITYVVFPCLSASEESVSLFEDDPEEYTRRYFDVNKEGTTADVASTDFIFVVGHRRFEEVSKILPLINKVFNDFASRGDLASAYQEEGALRLLSSLCSFLAEKDSPVKNELEIIFEHFVTPLLKQSKYPFLIARALETISIHQQAFSNMSVLSQIYEAVYMNFLNSEHLPIQVEAADALKTLIVSNPAIHPHISAQVPGIMEKLLKLSKEFEIDILSEVMESFVERFADELTPFAQDLAANLAEQFVVLGQSIVESSSGNYSTADQDQEIQASALLQTMTTMVMSMNKVSLIDKFMPVVKFIIVNAQITFLSEAVDLMDSLALSSKAMYDKFTPEIWEMLHDVLDSCQTYALEYFESFQVFFETIVTYGFPADQTFAPPFLEVLSHAMESGVDFDVESALDILLFYVLSMKENPLFEKVLKLAGDDDADLDVDESSYVKIFLAGLFTRPVETLQICEQKGATLEMLRKWFSCKFSSVLTIKLQLVAIISLLGLPELPSCINGFVPQLSDKLITLTASLPEAIRKRDALSRGELGESAYHDDGTEFFDEVEDDFKESCLDEVNCFQQVHALFAQLQSTNPGLYQQIMGSLSEDKVDTLQTILEFVGQN